MKSYLSLGLICLFVLGTALCAAGNPVIKNQPVSFAAATDNQKYITNGDLLMFISNHGNWGRDISGVWGHDYGTYYPYPGFLDQIIAGTYTKSPYYCGGLWLAAIDSATGDTVGAVSTYSDEYTPGPMSGGTFIPDAPEFHSYLLFSDSLAVNPNQDYLDYIQYAVAQGAPYSMSGSDTLPVMMGDEMIWSIYNDANAALHTHNAGQTALLGIEIKQTTFGSNIVNSLNAVFFRFRIFNNGSKVLKETQITFWSDPDMGNREDDFVGCDTTLELGYVYNADDDDTQYGTAPPAIGAILLQGPMVATGNDADTAKMWGQSYAGFSQMDMTSSMSYVNGADPANITEVYNLMNGTTASGAPYVYDSHNLKFKYSGNPLDGTGDLDIVQTDKKFLVTTGPIDLRPGDSTELYFVITVANGADNLDAFSNLLQNASYLHEFYGNDFQSPMDADNEFTVPQLLSLEQNFPNPFNPETTIRFALNRSGLAELNIFNILGELVASPINRQMTAGPHQVIWDGRDKNGNELASGIYFYRLKSGSITETKKMILLK
ncbi:MAG: T9SS type A sorting domain-containing protein [candidate division Zixibacteria bacterium]|nr:T9SS type A sorting domain-containing protein [candidate division Zixibacteria bacterium]